VEGNEVERGGEGGRGANVEAVVVAPHDQLIDALLALRTEGSEVGSGGEGGRGANVEVVVVAVHDQRVVARAALRKKTRSRAVRKEDAEAVS